MTAALSLTELHPWRFYIDLHGTVEEDFKSLYLTRAVTCCRVTANSTRGCLLHRAGPGNQLQVLEVLYIVYGGQVHISLPAVLLIIGPAQILVHLRVGFGDRKRAMVAQEEPCCRGNHHRQTAHT
ncbi:unnamed protein product [Boreogadus saida]